MPDHPTRLGEDIYVELDRRLAPVDRELLAQYPGDPGTRQPVHTVYVPADRVTRGLIRHWGQAANQLLREHAPDAATFAAATGVDAGLVAEVYHRVTSKLDSEPIEDLRLDFEDGYGNRPDDEEDAAAIGGGSAIAAIAAADEAPRSSASGSSASRRTRAGAGYARLILYWAQCSMPDRCPTASSSPCPRSRR